MWPFKKRNITPESWKPAYYDSRFSASSLEAFTLPTGGSAVMFGNNVPKRQDRSMPLSWPDLNDDVYGHRAMESLMGLFTQKHPACPDPNHFWCLRWEERSLILIAECYMGRHVDAPEENYIGVFLWPVSDYQRHTEALFWYAGEKLHGADLLTDEKPLVKMLLYPMPDGRVLVRCGMTKQVEASGSFYDQGVIDPETSETILTAGRRLDPFPGLPDSVGSPPPAYVLGFGDGIWRIARCWSTGWPTEPTKWMSTPIHAQLEDITNEIHPISR